MKYDLDKIKKLIEDNSSYANVLRALNKRVHTTNYKWLKRILFNTNIDVSHFKPPHKNKISLEILFQSKKEIGGYHFKNKLLKANLLDYKCYNLKCQISSIWLDEKISLQLDHIDGNRSNNLLENLRLLCPNCHSQTPTFAGKRNKKVRQSNHCKCGKEIAEFSKNCRSCAAFLIQKPKIDWPNSLDLINMVKNNGYRQSGKLLGVSDNAVKKHYLKITTVIS